MNDLVSQYEQRAVHSGEQIEEAVQDALEDHRVQEDTEDERDTKDGGDERLGSVVDEPTRSGETVAADGGGET